MSYCNELSLDRRSFLQGALLGSAPLCCVTPELPKHAFEFGEELLLIRLSSAPELRQKGEARAVVEATRGLNLIVVHDAEHSFAVLDRSCTHGGAQCAYNSRRHSLRCTSLNHAEYELDGTLLHGRTHGNLKSYRVRVANDVLEVSLKADA